MQRAVFIPVSDGATIPSQSRAGVGIRKPCCLHQQDPGYWPWWKNPDCKCLLGISYHFVAYCGLNSSAVRDLLWFAQSEREKPQFRLHSMKYPSLLWLRHGAAWAAPGTSRKRRAFTWQGTPIGVWVNPCLFLFPGIPCSEEAILAAENSSDTKNYSMKQYTCMLFTKKIDIEYGFGFLSSH